MASSSELQSFSLPAFLKASDACVDDSRNQVSNFPPQSHPITLGRLADFVRVTKRVCPQRLCEETNGAVLTLSVDSGHLSNMPIVAMTQEQFVRLRAHADNQGENIWRSPYKEEKL
ncbi:unnamed protein product [Pleuronectes platessa]|uniref:Uncharacterized protein n=1 Tax=Pleuronectes platessa TaxID=8262 RepID=A0A9N7VVA2_PLEPL|nr:unnamed protein product [Pleuronectes platessa]